MSNNTTTTWEREAEGMIAQASEAVLEVWFDLESTAPEKRGAADLARLHTELSLAQIGIRQAMELLKKGGRS